MAEMDLEQDMISLRKMRGVTQVELAQRIGVRQPVIARLESGGMKSVQLRTLVTLAQALGCRVKITLEPYEQQRRAAKKNGRRTAAA